MLCEVFIHQKCISPILGNFELVVRIMTPLNDLGAITVFLFRVFLFSIAGAISTAIHHRQGSLQKYADPLSLY